MNPTEIQWKVIQADLVAGVIYDEYYFPNLGMWAVWIGDFNGRLVWVYPDGRVKRVREYET